MVKAGLGLLLLSFGSLAAIAEEPVDGTASSTSNAAPQRLAPVVVEAPRESGGAGGQQTPAAVTVVPAAAIAAAGLETTADLPMLAPNLSLSKSVAGSYGDIYAMRGVANTQFFSDPTVVLYVDDAPAGDVFTYDTELLQLERVEIWRGPQGSVFGKNSEAGVINLVTRQPTDRFEAWGDASYATFDTQLYRGGVLGPLVKGKLYFGLAGDFTHSDGFLDNPRLDSHPDHQEQFNGRLFLGWIPSDGWDIRLTAVGGKARDGVRLVPLTGKPDQVSSDFNPEADNHSDGEALRISRTLPEFTLTSITTRRQFELDPLTIDLDLSPVSGNTALIRERETQWTEELRLESPPEADDWRWRAGFFFSTADHHGDDTRSLAGVPIFPQTTHFDLGEDNYAVFGQVRHPLVDKLAVTLGARLDYTVKNLDRTKTMPLGTSPVRNEAVAVPFGIFPVRDEAEFFNAAPKLTIDYRCSDRLLVYGSTGLGFKPGGFSAFMDDPRKAQFDTERNWANEIGLKSSWLEDRLLANLALFYNSIHDYQVERSIPNSTDLAVFNAPEVTARGVELELTAKPVPGLELSAVAGCTDIRFDRFDNPDNGSSLAGRRPPFVPEFNALVAAQYRHRCGLFARVQYQAVGRTYFEETNQAALEQSAYSLFDARFGYEAKNFSICFFGRNLTDTAYFTRKLVIVQPAGVPGTPQTVGVMASLKY